MNDNPVSKLSDDELEQASGGRELVSVGPNAYTREAVEEEIAQLEKELAELEKRGFSAELADKSFRLSQLKSSLSQP